MSTTLKRVHNIMNELETMWGKVLDFLSADLKKTAFDTWIAPLSPKEFNPETNILYIEADKKRVIDLVNDRYLHMIQNAVERATGKKIRVIGNVSAPEPFKKTLHTGQEKEILDQEYYLHPGYTFDNFIVGGSNQFAYQAALAVAEHPAKNFNPLFLYGGSGLGKTHLMNAIGHYILEHHKRKKVLSVSAEMFTNELTTSLGKKNASAFRKKYRNVDVLLIDDIQFIEGKPGIEQEFFHTFTNLHDSGKQIVISSDRPPKSFTELDERLISRFLWNVTAEIQPPDFETRVAILKSKAELAGIEMDDDLNQVINLIAEKIKDNIREMEGALTRIIAFSQLMNKPINYAQARSILKDILIYSDKSVSVEKVKRVVAKYYSISIKDMDSAKRTRNLAFPRQVAMYISKELTDRSLPQIGKSFGGKDHTTVLHAVKKISSSIETDETLKETIDYLMMEITKQ